MSTNANDIDVNAEIPSTDDSRTPTLAEVLRQLKEATKYEMRVCCPAKVVTYYKDTQTADVQPVYQSKYLDGSIEDPPIIFNAPVGFLRSAGAIIAMPLKKGDNVTLHFSDRSLEKWMTSGEIHYHEDTRAHHISDAIVYPGGYPLSQAMSLANSDDIIIINGSTEMRVKPNGHLQVLNPQNELITILGDFMAAVIAADQGGQCDALMRLTTFLES